MNEQFSIAGNVHVEEVLVGSQRSTRHIATGNVEQDVDTSPFGNDVISQFFKAGDVQYITYDADYIFTVSFQFFYTFVQLFLTDVNGYYFGALLHETFGNAATQYTTCTGDNGYFTCNTEYERNRLSFYGIQQSDG